MRIGIMSDSHGDCRAVDKAVQKAGKVDLWLHAGDCYPDAEYLELVSGTKVTGVLGNCDWPRQEIASDEIIVAGEHKILLTHGHGYDVNFGLGVLLQAAQENDCNIAVYGHTHIAQQVRSEGVLILNPGSIARPRGAGPASCMVLELKNKNLSVNLMELI